MSNHSWMAAALMVIGVIGVNFFYLSDMLMGSDTIELGTKSFIAIAGANAIAIAGIAMAARSK